MEGNHYEKVKKLSLNIDKDDQQSYIKEIKTGSNPNKIVIIVK